MSTGQKALAYSALLAASVILVDTTPTRAQETDAETQAIVEQLLPSRVLGTTRSIGAPKGVTRALVLSSGGSAAGGAGSGWIPNLKVTFAFDSAELTPDAMVVLDRLAAALKDEKLASYSFVVGGHTDALGEELYNEMLSERRAIAVVDYLTERHQIDRNRLQSQGFGEAELYDPANPNDGANRRVEIVTIDG